ncbi:MAG TPA: LpqB family beta-propeller domain-containing protein, partial [Planctomycetota bacterium]|nr:LpqB family beta-propeller domain-containing protein [Planctomycetota bacterium]
IELLRAWIAAGAPGPREGEAAAAVVLPKIAPKVAPRRAVNAVAWVPSSKSVAVARLAEVEILDGASRGVVRRLAGHAGPVNDLAVAPDGAWIAAAGGVPGASGEVRLWSLKDGQPIRTLKGHEDAIYAVAVSPDGRLLATGSYDRDIVLWDVATGKAVRTLGGHNEAVFDVAFRPDGRILASASADRTVKLWDVATGERRDTLTEATKALHAVAWTPDGKHVLAGGVDNRIRAWEVSAEAKEGSNPIRASAFAHEGTILALRVSRDGKRVLSTADDRTVKLFGPAPNLEPQRVLDTQPDWPVAAAFVSDDASVAVGRLDGTLAFYEAATGKLVAAPKPEPSTVWPRGVERGTGVEVRVSGKNMHAVSAARSSRKDVHVQLLKSTADAAWVAVTAEPGALPGAVDVWFGDVGPVKVWIDDLRQVVERESEEASVLPVPSSAWGILSSPGDTDVFGLDLKKGDLLVLDLAARRLGSKLEAVVTLSDATGRLLASNIDYEGDVDPFIAFPVPSDGRYFVRVSDLQFGFSEEHVYRLSVGPLPVVTGCMPLSVPANETTDVALIGHNLPPQARARVKAGGPGEADVPVDLSRLRVRKTLKVAVSAAREPFAAEPNERPSQTIQIPLPGGVNGLIDAPGDADLFRLEARKGQRWVLETEAARRGSPVDTRIEILGADGRPVERVLLRAVRDSYLTFRPIDANAVGGRFWQWEEMDLNQ